MTSGGSPSTSRWKPTASAFFEAPHVQHRYGRVLNHVLRYTQPGRATGVVSIDGVDEPVDGWFTAHDHSWGIRSTMGPPLPVHGAGPAPPDPRAMRLWVPFEVGGRAGFFHLHEDRHGDVLDCEGRVDRTDGGPSADVPRRRPPPRVRGGHRPVAGRHVRSDPRRRRFAAHGVHGDVRPCPSPGVRLPPRLAGRWQPGRVAWPPSTSRASASTSADPTLLAGPVHTDPSRRLGGTEFTARLSDASGGEGMAHIEHMRYRPQER